MGSAEATIGEVGGRSRLARAAAPESVAAPVRVRALDRRLETGLWILLVVFSFHGVFGHSLWGGNETREGGMIWDMVRNGTYVTPTINGTPFLEKPPLLHWTGVAVCKAAGTVTEGLVRLPAALYGLGTLLLLVAFVRGPRAPAERLAAPDGRQLASWAAAFLCGTAIEFQEYARIVLTDMALVFVVTLALVVFWRAYLRPTSWRWAAFLVAAAAAFYAKGLIGPVLIWASVAVFLLWKRRLRLLLGLAACYVPVFVALVLPWVGALYRFGGEPAVKFVFWDNQIGRFFTFANQNLPHDPFFINKERWYYYIVNVPLYLAPWTLLLVPAAVAWARRRSPFRTDFHLFIACGLAGMALVLQASSAKVANYALPLYPFLFAAVAVWLLEMLVRGRPTLLERMTIRVTGGGVALLFGLGVVVFIVGTLTRPRLFGVSGLPQAAAGIAGAVFVLALLAAAAMLLLRLVRSDERPLVGVLGPAAYVVAAMAMLQIATPVIDQQRSYKPIAALAAEEGRHGVTIGLGTNEYHDVGAFTFYLDRRLPTLVTPGDISAFLRAPEPRAVLVPVEQLAPLAEKLVGVPHVRLDAGRQGSLSRAYALLENQAGEVASGRAAAPSQGAVVMATHSPPPPAAVNPRGKRVPGRPRTNPPS